MNPHYKFTGDMEKKILARYLSGESSGFLAKEYSCDRSVITKMAKRYGHGEYASMVKGGVRGINTSHLNEKITKLHGDGLSQRVIGEAVGISHGDGLSQRVIGEAVGISQCTED